MFIAIILVHRPLSTNIHYLTMLHDIQITEIFSVISKQFAKEIYKTSSVPQLALIVSGRKSNTGM